MVAVAPKTDSYSLKKCGFQPLAMYFNSYLSYKGDVGKTKEACSFFSAMFLIGTLI